MREINIIITVTHIIDRELQCRGHNHTPSLKNKPMAFIFFYFILFYFRKGGLMAFIF